MLQKSGFAVMVVPLILALVLMQPAWVRAHPLPGGICHNIGGPDGLGADCGGADECELLEDPVLDAAFNAALIVALENGCNPASIYAGIFVPHSDNAFDAHIKHGDGPALVFLPNRIHATQPHVGANVDCFGARVNAQPP